VLVPAIRGLDAMVCTAGTGENPALVRRLICAWLGIVLNQSGNAEKATKISAPESRVKGQVIPTNEEAAAALACKTRLV
jgi:acetate kinase